MMSKKLQELEFFSKKTDGDSGEKKNGAGPVTSEQVGEMQAEVDADKVVFGKVIKKKFSGIRDTSHERICEITMELLHKIDLDHSGQIDYKEFYEFFANNDEFVVSNENIRNMFQEFDKDDNDSEQTINLEELAKAIKSALISATNQQDDDSSHK